MSIKRLTPTTLFTLVGYGAIGGGFILFGLLPCWQEASALRRVIAERRAAQVQALADSRRLATLTQRADLLHLEIRDFAQLVPDQNGLGSFWEQLSHELDATGVQNTTVRALAPTRLGKCQQLPIEVHGTGTFAQLHDFLTHLECLPRKSSVSRLNLDSDPAMTDKVTIDLTLSIYNTLPLENKAGDYPPP